MPHEHQHEPDAADPRTGPGDPPADEEVGWPNPHDQPRIYSDTVEPGTTDPDNGR